MYTWEFPYRSKARPDIPMLSDLSPEEQRAAYERVWDGVNASVFDPDVPEEPAPPAQPGAPYPDPLPIDYIDANAYPFRTPCPLNAMAWIWKAMRGLDRLARDADAGDTEKVKTGLEAARFILQIAVDEIVWHEYHLTGNPEIIRPVLLRVSNQRRNDRRLKSIAAAAAEFGAASDGGSRSPQTG